MRMMLTTSFLLLAFTAAACADKGTAPAPSEQAPSQHEAKPERAVEHHAHAAVGVKAGSHEDWCGEHAVPESLCTRCNASLIAAFKATGDWCEEHGLPESQCLVCNPQLKIERPPPAGSQ